MAGFQVCRYSPLITLGNAHFLPDLIRIKGYDLIHLHYPFFGGEFSGLAAWIDRIPLVITYHHDVILRGMKSVLEGCLRWTIERWLLRSAEIILFTSKDYANSSLIRPHLNGCEKRIATLPNGIDLLHFYPSRESKYLKNSLGYDMNDFRILLVANLDRAHYFKGVEIFLNALEKLPQQVKGLIVGDGDLRHHYENMARVRFLETRVNFVGSATCKELRDYYNLADVTVMPSTTRGEAFGLVLLESLACCTPVIASDLPGVRTVVDDGQDGFLVKPGDTESLVEKVLFLRQNTEKSRLMGKCGREKMVESYSWVKIIEKLEGIYNTLLN
jgi:glycosyltransferase involved in cell wall biosynthesis